MRLFGSDHESILAPCPALRFDAASRLLLPEVCPDMNFRNCLRPCARAAATAACLIVIGAAPARADQCDDLAKQLASHITDLKLGATRGGVIYLEHPAVKQAWLACSGPNVKNALSASSPALKPSKEFLEVVATATALVFTIPKNDALSGIQRCTGRIGLIRGYNITTRYRKLDIRCGRTKDTTQVTVSREKGS